MPKTKLHNTSSVAPKKNDIFDDFEPPMTTDGSYLGIQKHVKATQQHLQKKFEQKFDEAKQRLKAAKTRVGLVVASGTIQLQATLPLRDGDTDTKGTGTKQYKISLGIPANIDGLKTAEEEAYELGKLIAHKTFEWNDKYLGRLGKKIIEESKPKTFGELLNQFEEEYFKARPRNRKSEGTFKNHFDIIKRFFDSDQLVTEAEVKSSINKIPAGTATRVATISALSVLFKLFSIEISLKGLKSGYKPKRRMPPNKEDILDYFHYFQRYAAERNYRASSKSYVDNWKFWRWCYGMLATFGLRPEELFINSHIDYWLNPKNIDNAWKVDKDCKTGERVVFAIIPDWIEIFDLKNIEYLNRLKQISSSLLTHIQVDSQVITLALWFKKVGIPFQPYDLRHAFAINGHLLGISIKVMADNMGHSVEMHTSTYQRYFSEENRKQMINEALSKKSEVELLREENINLKEKIKAQQEIIARLQEQLNKQN
ncbi:site-specific integrase [Nostoc sp. FACHB-110]|uniref:site-specific integrase n=1 Tax=Nostoc sp. FACHB-110 TaxID=2692834 RepID=UPI0016863037|nr:site-specific integrase [Nostoc sp. FACHB-110]MBD2436596.1 site-specific integrase [Nostoc sp. FACHB-110]